MTEEPELARRILSLLAAGHVAHDVLRHEPVFTSEQAAAMRGTPLAEGAKALVCRADARLVLIVMPADRRLDSRAFRRAYGVKDLRMASADEVERLGTVAGGVPPFGSAMGLQTYADEELRERARISFNVGSRTTSVTIAPEDYFALERPIVGRFIT